MAGTSSRGFGPLSWSVLTLALTASGCRAAAPAGETSADAAVRTYLHAIETNDPRAAYDVVARNHRTILRARVRRFAGIPATAVSVQIHEPIRPDAGRTVVLVFRRPGAAAVEDEVTAQPRSGRWYVAFPVDGPCEPGAICESPST